MRVRLSPGRLASALPTLAAAGFAGFVVVDTLRAIVPVWSPLPWFDEWATMELLRAWQGGEASWLQILFVQHNEHRILVPRLVFFTDDLLFGGEGRLSLVAIFVVQALHAAFFVTLLARARQPHAGRWAVAAAVVASMFGLCHVENFSSGFQLQFLGVFAGASLTFALFGLAAARMRQGRPAAGATVAAFSAALATSLTMANGLAAGFVLAILSVLGRMGWRVTLACAVWAVLLAVVYLHGLQPGTGNPLDSLRQPLALSLYIAAYLGGLAAGGPAVVPVLLGALGLAATGVAVLRAARRAAAPAELALVGIMLFVVATAIVTAMGRLGVGYGIGQALPSRYAVGSATFGAAQLAFWWIVAPRLSARVAILARAAVLGVSLLLCGTLAEAQQDAKPQIALQSFARNEATDLLLLGFHDPAILGRIAWDTAFVERLLPVLREDRLSVFATREAEALGAPMEALGTRTAPDACRGSDLVALTDPALGPDGARVSGRVLVDAGGPSPRRILLADAAGRLVGLASGAVPGAPRGTWRGYAAAPAGASLTAFGWLPGRRLCHIGEVDVTPPSGAETSRAARLVVGPQASQPEAAP